jgi:pSer/pThr/pTyr-binding forkhead associated (FHA) protein
MSQPHDETARFSGDLLASDAPTLSPEEQAAIAALPKNSALLIAQRGPSIGSRFLLDDDTSVAGRHPNADIFLDDVTVSRRHVEFSRNGVSFSLRDMGSMNGTYLNGARVEQNDLKTGDEIQIGKYHLTFFAGSN